MQNITLQITNPEIQKFLLEYSEEHNKSVSDFVKEIIELFYLSKQSKTTMPLDLLQNLIKQSENDYKEGKLSSHSDFIEEAKKW